MACRGISSSETKPFSEEQLLSIIGRVALGTDIDGPADRRRFAHVVPGCISGWVLCGKPCGRSKYPQVRLLERTTIDVSTARAMAAS
jgi:hypothetical protein